MLKTNKHEDSKYDINWVSANCKTVMLNRRYLELHEPTYSGVSLIAQDPNDSNWLMEYGHNEEGFLSVREFTKRGRVYEVVSFKDAIKALEENTARVIKELAKC